MRPYSVESADELRLIFEHFYGNRMSSTHSLHSLLKSGELELHKQSFDTNRYTIDDWAQEHERNGLFTDSESRRHLLFKTLGAWYLSYTGHQLEKKPYTPSADSVPLYRFDESNFEKQIAISGFRADVVCDESCCNSVLEVGYTPPKRALSAFGYSILKSDTKQRIGKPARTDDTPVKKLYVIPYQSPSDGTYDIFRLSCTESISEPDPSLRAEATGAAFEQHDES